jgi:hypothetical protein
MWTKLAGKRQHNPVKPKHPSNNGKVGGAVSKGYDLTTLKPPN